MNAILLLLVLGADPAPRDAYDYAVTDVEQEVVVRANACRTAHGLRPLVIDRVIMRSARQQSAAMAWNGVMQHNMVGNSAYAENIAMGQRSPQEVVDAWWNSSGHRRNMMNGGYSYIGVAAYVDDRGKVYWTQQFR